MSDKTTFFANMLAYSKERGLPPMQTAALCRTKTPLNDLYLCFMNNNEDYLQRANTAVKVLYHLRANSAIKIRCEVNQCRIGYRTI